MKTILLQFASFIIFSTQAFSAVPNLGPEKLSQLKSGKTVKEIVQLDGEIWPEVTVIGLIPHSPKENVQVFTDFETHKSYIPDIIKSNIVKKVSPTETWVEYKMKMPWPVSDSEYTTSNIVKQDGDNYIVTWHLIKANQMKATKGTVKFEALDGKTLLTYTSHITPDSSLAGMFTSRVDDDVEKTVHIIIDHLNKKLSK